MTVEVIGFVIVVIVMATVVVRCQYMKNQLKERENLETAANQLRLQIEEVADDVISRMENRIDHLEMLIGEADAKISELDDKLQCVQNKTREETQAATAISKEEASARLPEKAEPRKLQEKPVLCKQVKKFSDKELSPMNKKVLELFESGCSLDDIARQTGMGKGALLMIKEMYKN